MPNPFTALTSKIFGGMAIAAMIVAGLFYVLYKGEARHSAKVEANLAISEANHAQTVTNYKTAARTATTAAAANVVRVHAEQERITDATLADYRRRIAAVRLQHRTSATATGGADPTDLPSLSDPASGIVGAPDSAELRRDLLALQLDALISWVEAQASVPVTPLTPAQ